MRRTAWALAAATLVAACAEVPQPFRHEGPPHALARPKLMRGVTIKPMDDSAESQAMAAAVVKALEPLEIPAVVRSGPAFGHVLEPALSPVGVQWVLKAPDGEALPIHAHRPTGDFAEMRRHAQETAAALSNRLTDPDARPPANVSVPKRQSIKLVAFRGLPGDGDKALTLATKRALERSGFLLSDVETDYVVEGRVQVIPGLPGEDTVVVTWMVRTGDGKEMASIDQEGVVPRGRLAESWGGLARDIAEGGAAGVIESVAAASRKGGS